MLYHERHVVDCVWETGTDGLYYCLRCDPNMSAGRIRPVRRNCIPANEATIKALRLLNAMIQARQVVCNTCPDNNWESKEWYCLSLTHNACTHRQALAAPFKLCRHWPE